MLKKISVFLATKLRQKMETEPQWCSHKGLQKAMLLPADMLRFLLHEEARLLPHLDLHSDDSYLAKHFDGSHCESHTLHGLISRANRMETYLYMYGDPGNEIVVAHTCWYKVRQKEAIGEWQVSFNKDGIHCGGLGPHAHSSFNPEDLFE